MHRVAGCHFAGSTQRAAVFALQNGVATVQGGERADRVQAAAEFTQQADACLKPAPERRVLPRTQQGQALTQALQAQGGGLQLQPQHPCHGAITVAIQATLRVPGLQAQACMVGALTGAFKGLREDKAAAEVTQAPQPPTEMGEADTKATTTVRAAAKPGKVVVAGVTISSPDKVLWPAVGDRPAREPRRATFSSRARSCSAARSSAVKPPAASSAVASPADFFVSFIGSPSPSLVEPR